MYYIDNKSKHPKLKRKLKDEYLKGQRGVRLYYDSNHFDEYILEEDVESEGNVKCVFTKSLRREKMWNYFKYLNGKKIGIHELAWKFAVTERTIQNDIKFLVDNGYIEKKRNNTSKGKQTKNSYITLKEYQSGVATMFTFLQIIYLAKKDNDWYIISRTDYDESKVKYKVRNIKDFTFTLPHKRIYSKNNIDELSIEFTNKIFSQDLQNTYQGIVFEHISKNKYIKVDKFLHKKKKIKQIKCFFVLYKLDECLKCNKGFRWIKLSIAPKRIKDFKVNKGIHYICKNLLG